MRLEGWDQRLHEIIEAARYTPYVLGEHDCFRLACRVVEALTGDNRWPMFCGYRTEREALAALAVYGSSFVNAGDKFFGDHVDTKLARRGDVLGYMDSHGKWHLGVCVGADMALLGPDGLMFQPLSMAKCCWRVG